MIHASSNAEEFVNHFSSRAPASESIITLGGTGPNGSCQIPILELIGYEKIQDLKIINILSGSAFGYFIYLAFYEGKLRKNNYRNYDTSVRELHKASCFKALKHFLTGSYKSDGLYDNKLVMETVFLLFESEYANRTLKDFRKNLVFWSYCSKNDSFIKITPHSFPDMKVWEVITACLSIKPIHGEFITEENRFSDPMFSPAFKQLFKDLIRKNANHLYLSYKINTISKNIIFLQNQPLTTPSTALLFDFLAFTCNFRNSRLIKTHHNNLSLLSGAQSKFDNGNFRSK